MDDLTSIGNVTLDGEMGIGESHLESESISDSFDHVLDMRSDGVDTCFLLSLSQPHLDTDLVVVVFGTDHVEATVFEGSLENAQRTFHAYVSALEIDVYVFRDIDQLFGEDGFHLDINN
jgi:hypothetical protein